MAQNEHGCHRTGKTPEGGKQKDARVWDKSGNVLSSQGIQKLIKSEELYMIRVSQMLLRNLHLTMSMNENVSAFIFKRGRTSLQMVIFPEITVPYSHDVVWKSKEKIGGNHT